jgi:RNA-dependent RNA polymerase
MKGRLLKKYDEESEYFLRVAVCDDHEGTLKNQKYITKAALKSKMLELNILGRKYIPLGWSPSQLRAYSLWYIHQTNDTSSGRRITREQVLNFLGSFDTIENPAKRAARIGQSFSASWTYDASRIKYIVEDDIISDEGFLFTDGIGKISRDLIESISLKLGLTELAVIQIRYLGGKGILVLDESLPKNTVVLRPSMIKYKCQH